MGHKNMVEAGINRSGLKLMQAGGRFHFQLLQDSDFFLEASTTCMEISMTFVKFSIHFHENDR